MDSKQQIAPMRLYTNWADVDRSSTSSISRVLSMVFTMLVFTRNFKFSGTNSLVIAIRQKGQRRTLKSGDLTIFPQSLEYHLEISFIIQYSHFIKKRSNVLQILLQRRKRYKNRQIPGYKTLAIGSLNLDEVMQSGGSFQVFLWDTAYLKSQRSSLREFHAGTIHLSNCSSQAALESSSEFSSIKQCTKTGRALYDISVDGKNSAGAIIQSDDDEFSSGVDSSEADDIGASSSHHSNSKSRTAVKTRLMQRKQYALLKQKNIKQKITSLIRRFRQDDEPKDIILPDAEYELQEIFDELDDNVSDYSGPELLEEPDRSSTVTNLRPGLRPYFGSRSTILAATAAMLEECEKPQGLSDELSGDSLLFADLEEQELGQSSSGENDDPPPEPKPKFSYEEADDGSNFPVVKNQNILQESPKSHHPSRHLPIRHSSTIEKMPILARSLENISQTTSNETVLNASTPDSSLSNTYIDLISQLEDMSMTQSSIIPSYVWLCSTADLPWLAKINSRLLGSIRLIDCPTLSEVNVVLQAFINRIQKFCNTNSVAPSTTTIGILGGDRLLANVLQCYVQLLQHKACQEEWVNYLRFSLVVTPTSSVGRLLAQVADGGYSEAAWKALCKISANFNANSRAGPAFHAEIRDCLLFGIAQSTPKRTTNLSIGEVMLQLMNTSTGLYDTPNKSQIFVPFLAELLTKGEGRGDTTEETNASPLHYMDSKLLTQPLCSYNEPTESRSEVSDKAGASSLGPPARFLNKFRAGIAKSIETEGSTQVEDEPFSSRRLDKSQTRNEFLQHTCPLSASPSPISSVESRELQIEYWMGSYTSGLHSETHSSNSVGSFNFSQNLISEGKFSIKSSIRMLSVAREPMTHLLSILFVKDRKKDKVLQKLSRKNKQRSLELNTANQGYFDTQSRVVSGVSRVVCTCGNLGGPKRMPLMDVFIDGVLWNRVRYFQVSPQWQTHVRMFPVSFPLVPTVNVWPISC